MSDYGANVLLNAYLDEMQKVGSRYQRLEKLKSLGAPAEIIKNEERLLKNALLAVEHLGDDCQECGVNLPEV